MGKLITTEMAAREFTRLLHPETKEGIEVCLSIGREKFRDMGRFDVFWLRGSLDQFAACFIAPEIIADLRKRLRG